MSDSDTLFLVSTVFSVAVAPKPLLSSYRCLRLFIVMTDQYRKVLDAELSGLGVAPAGDPELRVISNIAWAIRRSIGWIFLAAFAVAFAAYVLTYTSDTKYTSSAKVMIDTRVQTETQFTTQVSGLPLSLTSLESELELLRSTDIIESVVDRLQLQDDPEFSGAEGGFSLNPISWARSLKDVIVNAIGGSNGAAGDLEPEELREIQRAATVEKLLESRQIEQIGEISAVYRISVTSKSPQKAASIANYLASEYLTVLTRMKRDDLDQAQQWLSTRINQIREDLNVLSSELESHSIETPFSPEEYATIKAQRIKSEKRAQLVDAEIVEQAGHLSTIQNLINEGKTQEAISYASEVGVIFPSAAMDTPEEQAEVLDTGVKALETKLEVLNGQKVTLEKSIETFKEQQVRQVQHDSVTKRIENEILVVETIYRDFVAQLGRRAEQRNYLDAGAHIIERARVSVDPSAPKRSSVALTTMFAVIFLGLGFTVVRELLQKRLRTTFELENTTGVKLSAIIPEVKNEPPFETFFMKNGKLDPTLMHYGRKLLASSAIGLRTMRRDDETTAPQSADLFAKNSDNKHKKRIAEEGCTIFSGAAALPDEGNTSTLLLIGSVCAQAGYRTLIIDCDTLTSTYRDLSQMTAESLKLATTHPLSLENYIVGTPQDGLDILPLIGTQENEGQIKSVEDFLCSTAFVSLLRSLSGTYNTILLDTPPLLSAVESGYLSQLSDRVILFARWNSTRRKSILQAMRELENAGVRPSALVATRVDMKRVKLYGDPFLG
ncbi:exopolysaccharide transport family protein [Ruegeria atlantica]|uniref:exopolysaccharide transport family protein n=1 Tax=Ruegeria atlantica TaxID=81569 RepID=UPI001C2BD526|nr:Wzz/FepE/Etk N-terminal domain-containing protein [Ruegeria atlantica]